MLRNIKIYSQIVLKSNFNLRIYKISLVHLGDKKYTKGRLIPLRTISKNARPVLVKKLSFENKELDKFKRIDKYNDCFVFVKNEKKGQSTLGIDIVKKSNHSLDLSDSLIKRNARQELIHMNFDDRKSITSKNIMLVSSKFKYEFMNNYTSF